MVEWLTETLLFAHYTEIHNDSLIILKYNVFIDRAKKLYKREQKDRTKTLAEFPKSKLMYYLMNVCVICAAIIDVEYHSHA